MHRCRLAQLSRVAEPLHGPNPVSIPVHCSTTQPAGVIPPAAELSHDSLPWTEIDSDWYGRKLDAPLKFRLELYRLRSGAPDLLVVRFELPVSPTPRDDTAPGEFVEGLWNFDVAELFLLDAAGAYLEFNLSPYGEWWACRFSDYRAGSSPQHGLRVKPRARITSDGWSGELYIPAAEISSTGINPTEAKIHISAILGSGADRRFISSRPCYGIDPDFHHAEVFDTPSYEQKL